MKLKDINYLLWAKRLLCYVCGQFCMALGVVFSVRSNLGVSPVTSVANAAYQIFGVDMGIELLSLGMCTTLSYLFYILVEFVILGKRFKPIILLQIIASTLFGYLVNLAAAVLDFLPDPGSYAMQMVYLLCSIPLVAFGVMLYLATDILPTPGDGVPLSLSIRIGKPVAYCKIITDCCMVALSVVASVVYFGTLIGVREGTVIAALFVGLVMKRFMKWFQKPLYRFLQRESKTEAAPAPAAEKSHDGPQIIITLSQQFASGGYDITRELARRMGITFYDRQLIAQEAEESGLPESFVQSHEDRMYGSLFRDYIKANWDFYGSDLDSCETLFATRANIIRRLAASGESFVINGRCANFILYDHPNAFRIFIHAPAEVRAARRAEQSGADISSASQEVTRVDYERSRHFRQFTGRQWGKPDYYHVCIDSEAMGFEGSIELLTESIRIWQEAKEKK